MTRPHELSVPEHILKLQDEWDAIASHADDVPVTPAQAAELDRRLKAHEAAPDDVIPWSEVKRSLRVMPEYEVVLRYAARENWPKAFTSTSRSNWAGQEFLSCVEAAIEKARRHPTRHREVHVDVRLHSRSCRSPSERARVVIRPSTGP